MRLRVLEQGWGVWRVTARQISVLVVLTTLNGCALAGPSSSEIRQLQQHVDNLSQRIDQLERARGQRASDQSTLPVATEGFGETEGTFVSSDSSSAPSGSASAVGDAFTKFFRGGVNLVTGWVEIPKRITETSQQSGMAVGLTWGLLRGLGYGFIRTAAGLYELVTFPVAAPPGYRPVMEPPFVFE